MRSVEEETAFPPYKRENGGTTGGKTGEGGEAMSGEERRGDTEVRQGGGGERED